MNLLIEFATFYGLFWWVMCVLYKDNKIQSLLNNVGIWLQTKTPIGLIGRIVQGVGLCKFCIESHTATLGAIGYSCYWLEPHYLIWGFLCASINGFIREFKN
jgi:hypothetical protein